MSKSNWTYKKTLQLVYDTLSFDFSITDLEARLKTDAINWETLVKVASNQYVLTTFYCRMEQKQLLDLLPEDLTTYLSQLTSINRNRNTAIAKEVTLVANLFIKNQIEHVFFKGAGLLMGGYFKDFGERMIGDIDVLVRSKDKKCAFDLLTQNGYDHSIGFDYDNKDYRHLPRQVNNKNMAAVEIHDNILINGHRHLIDLDPVFEMSIKKNNINIASRNHLQLINILTAQLNNYGYYYNHIPFRSVFDTMVLRYEGEDQSVGHGSKNRFIISYLDLYTFWKTNNQASVKNYWRQSRIIIYAIKISNARLEGLIYKAQSMYWKVNLRISLFTNNNSYRRHILKNKIFSKS